MTRHERRKLRHLTRKVKVRGFVGGWEMLDAMADSLPDSARFLARRGIEATPHAFGYVMALASTTDGRANTSKEGGK